jgi:hypothetical protein
LVNETEAGYSGGGFTAEAAVEKLSGKMTEVLEQGRTNQRQIDNLRNHLKAGTKPGDGGGGGGSSSAADGADSGSSRTDIKCYNCGKVGHIGRNCPDK